MGVEAMLEDKQCRAIIPDCRASRTLGKNRGVWQLCDDLYFRGNCMTLQPGEYLALRSMGMNDRISSVRELGGWGPPPQQSGGGNWGEGIRVVLYEGPNFSGRSYVISGNSLS